MRNDRYRIRTRLPFFLPNELIGFRYLTTSAEDKGTEKAGEFQREIDLAFFIVNFGFTKRDYMELTPRERAFVYRAWEDKLVRDSQLNHDATLLAEANAHRKRGRSVKPLWTKHGRVDPEEMQRLVQKEKSKQTGITGILNRIRGH